MSFERLAAVPGLGWLLRWRFAKFGTVGASGTLVNLAVLWIGQEWLFAGVSSMSLRLDLSLALAIFCATVNNFLWNRLWTWQDRRAAAQSGILVQFAKYTAASWLGIAIQFLLTRWLAAHMYYLAANVLAIVAASVFNYVANDLWTFRRFAPRQGNVPKGSGAGSGTRQAVLVWHVTVVVLAVATYFHGLGSLHIPKNGDEFVYAHITRVTAASGHLLPLESDLDRMRNTKPPLLFWQGIASTDAGRDWTLANLRIPGALYTCLTALMVGVLAWRISGQAAAGLVAAAVYFAFFSTYRYGRPFLTNPPETFWLSLPFFILVFTRPHGFASRGLVPLCAGLVLGIALLYKSFALAVPAGAGLAWWYLHERRYRIGTFLRRDVLKIAFSLAVALGLFALWFAFDPQPEEIWREFVVGENVGKFESGESYFARLLWGGSSVWRLALGYLENAGLLAAIALATFVLAWRHRREACAEERLLWLWIATLFIVFALPSQRSSRYLLPAMPFLAALVALHWQRLPRLAHVATLALVVLVASLLAWLALGLQAAYPGERLYSAPFWILLAAIAVAVIAGIVNRRIVTLVTPAATLASLLAYSLFLEPFDGARGQYSREAQAVAAGKNVWVPCNFRATPERYRFLLPGANVLGYPDEAAPDPWLSRGLVAVQVPIGQSACVDCKVIGERLDLKGRHDGAAIRRMLAGDVLPHLFVREMLVTAGDGGAAPLARADEGACR